MLHVYGKRRPKYFFIVNMDQAILNALELFDKLIDEKKLRKKYP